MMSPLRAGQAFGLAALALVVWSDGLQTAVADGDTRSLTLRHTHRDDQITVTFKRDGKYDEEGLKELNHFLRDWRNDKEIKMDPHLFDVVWEVYREVDGKEPIEIVSAYRSPETNAWLHAHSSGVAQFSQHILGKAMDFYIPGVPLEEIRYAGLRLQRGGVGFYPTSGSPFVHLDTGNVRHWPRMAPQLLAKVLSMPKEKLFASAERRRMPEPAAEDETEVGRIPVASAAPARKGEPAKPATAPNARQAFALAAAESKPVVLDPPRPPAPVGTESPENVQSWLKDIEQRPAAKDRVAPELALSYATAAAAEKQRTAPPARVAGMGPLPKLRAGAATAQPKLGQRDDDPWMRMITLAESVQDLDVTNYGEFDAAGVRMLMRKPATIIEQAFRDDPYDGMTAAQFTGSAVAFLNVVPFAGLTERQASLK